MQPCVGSVEHLWSGGGWLWESGTVARLGDGIEPDLDTTCPRCGETGRARFYGPCETCRVILRATLGSEARAIESAAYEPKMNVTPNAVATKD